VHLAYDSFKPLIRYYVWVLPSLLLAFAIAVRHLGEGLAPRWNRAFDLILGAILVSLIGLSLLNRHGTYYPKSEYLNRAFSKAERSMEYLDFHAVQRAVLKDAEEHVGKMPVFVTRGEYYYLSSPLMAYADDPPSDVRLLLDSPWNKSQLEEFPDEFFLVDAQSNAFHGQAILTRILQAAEKSTAHQVEALSTHRRGGYLSRLLRVKRVAELNREPTDAVPNGRNDDNR
jgi:hypothetical protein